MQAHVPVRALLAAAAGALPVSSAAAQQFGQDGSPFVGIWNSRDGNQTVIYRPDGTSEGAIRMPVPGYDGMMLLHAAGRYQIQPAGPGRYRVRLRVARVLPSQVCQTVNGQPAGCRALPMPNVTDGSVTFLSRDVYRDEYGLVFVRANGPGLLAVPVSPRLMVNTNSPPPGSYAGGSGSGGAGYTTPNGTGYVSPRRPSRPTDGNLQQQRICTINDGHIITYPDGRQECKAPY